MGFLKSDESIVLMDLCPSMGADARHLNDVELDMLYKVGCRTLLEYVCWWTIEQDMGSRVWNHLDEYIHRAREHGFKVILSTPHFVPGCFPKEWYPWDRAGNAYKSPAADGTFKGVLSLFSVEAMQYEVQFIRAVKARYEAEDVLLYCSQQVEGETIYANGWAYGDPGAQSGWQTFSNGELGPMEFSNSAFTEWLQRTYILQLLDFNRQILDAGGDDLEGPVHNEIWTAIHPLLSAKLRANVDLLGNGCDWYSNILGSYRNYFPDTVITWLQYTYFPHGDGYRALVRDESVGRRIQHVIGGAEWVQGLRYSAPGLLQWGLQALLLGIIHPFSGHKEVTSDMAAEVKWAIDLIKEHRGP